MIIPESWVAPRELAAVMPRGGRLPATAWRMRHRGIVALLWIHVLGFALAAATSNSLDAHNVIEFGSIAVLAGLASWPRLTRASRTVFASAGLIGSSGLLVHISQGLIEFHFHFFVVVAIVSLYEQWMPFLLALAYVLVEHGVMGTIAPGLIYNHAGAWAAPWEWALLHAAFIFAAGIANVVHWRLNEVERHGAAEEHEARIQAQAAAAEAQVEIATRREVEAALKRQADELQQQARLLDLAEDAMFVWELDTGAIRFWNRGAEELYGWPREDVLGRTPAEILKTKFPEPLPQLHEVLHANGRWEGEVLHTCRDGSEVTVRSRWALNRRGALDGPLTALATNTNITDQKRARAELEYQAQHDALTGLPNRHTLLGRIHRLLSEPSPVATGALLMLDLDGFKDVNDTLGHGPGDALLILVAKRLGRLLREGDTLARLGGDEFAVLLPRTSASAAERVARKLLDAFHNPFDLDDSQVSVSASIGVATFPRDAADPDALMRCADVAMYVAKRSGSGTTTYERAFDEQTQQRVTIIGDLRRALNAGELLLHYQPKVSCQDGGLAGVEGLVRWQHPERGLIPPDQFIPFAEQSGLITELGQRVLRMAIQQCRDWNNAGSRIPVAVNLSMRELIDPGLAPTIEQLLSEANLDPGLLRLEVTETSLMLDPLRVRSTLDHLSGLGVRISVDDYGTGYSSLRYLHELPADELKIDRSFVRNLASSPGDLTIVRSTIELAHGLGLQVVAEGVENGAALELLARYGCDLAQGYHIGRPMPAATLESWLHRARPALPQAA